MMSARAQNECILTQYRRKADLSAPQTSGISNAPRDPHDDPPAKRRPQPYLGPPVKLGHIRSHGVRNLLIYALPAAAIQRSHHTDRWPDEITLIGLCPKAARTRCDMVGADVRPNWSERPKPESPTGTQWPLLFSSATTVAPSFGHVAGAYSIEFLYRPLNNGFLEFRLHACHQCLIA
jgi:hypothetical protein